MLEVDFKNVGMEKGIKIDIEGLCELPINVDGITRFKKAAAMSKTQDDI